MQLSPSPSSVLWSCLGTMAESIQLAHLPPDLTLLVACYKDVENAPFLREQLLAANQTFNYAFIDASAILSRRHLLSAAFRALNDFYHDRLKSNNVHSEIVFCLSPNNNIGDAFRRFGVQDTTKDLVVLKVAQHDDFTAATVTDHLDSAVQGTRVPLTDQHLSQLCDLSRLRKTYKLGPKQQNKGANGNHPSAQDEISVLEPQVIGTMALRGAT